MARENRRKREERRFGRPERLADLTLNPVERPSMFQGNERAIEGWRQTTVRVKSAIAKSVIVDATNIDSYCQRYQGKDIDFFKDVPNYMPPFSPMMIEVHPDYAPNEGYAFLVQLFDDTHPMPSALRKSKPEFWPSDHSRFVLAEQLLAVESEHGLCLHGPCATFLLPVNENGSLAGQIADTVAFSAFMNGRDFESLRKVGHSGAFPVFMAIAFMHCKNMVLQPHDPDPAVARERKKAGLRPFVRYHTINIEPMKRVLRTEGNIETEGLKKALHICRGHFATYSEERPLFGKHAGTFWVPAHTRGSLKSGVVVSDYNVKAPKGGDS